MTSSQKESGLSRVTSLADKAIWAGLVPVKKLATP